MFSAYVPGSQGVHTSELLFSEKKPAGQLWHVEALDSLENVPAGHASCAEEPGGQKNEMSHDTLNAGSTHTLPAGQTSGALVPSMHRDPGEQVVGCEAPEMQNDPAGHVVTFSPLQN